MAASAGDNASRDNSHESEPSKRRRGTRDTPQLTVGGFSVDEIASRVTTVTGLTLMPPDDEAQTHINALIRVTRAVREMMQTTPGRAFELLATPERIESLFNYGD